MKLLVPDRWKIELGNDGGYYQEAFSLFRLEEFAKSKSTTMSTIIDVLKTVMTQLGFNVSFSTQKEEFVVNVIFKSEEVGVALNFMAGEFIGCSQIGSMTLNELIMQAAINKGREIAKNNIVDLNVK